MYFLRKGMKSSSASSKHGHLGKYGIPMERCITISEIQSTAHVWNRSEEVFVHSSWSDYETSLQGKPVLVKNLCEV